MKSQPIGDYLHLGACAWMDVFIRELMAGVFLFSLCGYCIDGKPCQTERQENGGVAASLRTYL